MISLPRPIRSAFHWITIGTARNPTLLPLKRRPSLLIRPPKFPASFIVGQDVSVVSSINNIGQVVLYNVVVGISDSEDILSSSELYLGNIQPGNSASVNTYLTPIETGNTTITYTVTYENESGEKQSVTQTEDISVDKRVNTQVVIEDPGDTSKFPYGIVAIVGLIVVNLLFWVGYMRIKKQKQRQKDISDALALDYNTFFSPDEADRYDHNSFENEVDRHYKNKHSIVAS